MYDIPSAVDTAFSFSPWWQLVILVITNACTWLFGKWQTRRERKQTDLQIIEQAIAPQLESIGKLTEQNGQLVEMFLNEQRLRLAAEGENTALKAEREELKAQISGLSRKINNLEKKIDKLASNENNNHPRS
ncbi:MAG: hypothetical protein LUF04_16215 [Bacteroides sp.]|nr:hypothetical protein [Bacteroides sp.]